MKCFVRTMLLVVSLLTVSVVMMPSVSFAEDVWAYSEDEYVDVYVDTDRISIDNREPRYRGLVKIVSRKDGTMMNFYPAGFDFRNGQLVGFTYFRSQGYWEYHGAVVNDSRMNAIWKVMKPYLKQKGASV